MGPVRRVAGPPPFRFPVPVSVLVPALVPVLLQPGPGYESEFMQGLLEQSNKTRYLPCPIFSGRPLICLGRFPMSPGVLHVVVGLTDFPVGLTLTAFGFVDVVHHIRDSAVQVVQHMCRTF